MKKWRVTKTSVVHKNKHFCIVCEDFCLSGDRLGKYYLMKMPDFVAVLPVEDEYIYFIQMNRYALKRSSLELPMGGMEEGETPLSAARRELREETGITAKKMQKIGCLDACKGRTDQRFSIFIAQDLSFGQQNLDEVEKDGGARVVKLKISEVPELIRKGKITDSHTIATFQLFMLNYKD